MAEESVETKQDQEVHTKDKAQKTESKQKAKEKHIKILESEHKRLIEEAAEHKDKYVRLYAEFDNARKRMERDKQEFVKYANEGLITELLGIVDSLELSLKAAQEKKVDDASLVKGIEMVIKQMQDLLSRNGIKPIKAVGGAFDPNCHEILMQEETDKVEDGAVMEEFQKGYCLHERVIRTAKVKVAKKTEEKQEEKNKTCD